MGWFDSYRTKIDSFSSKIKNGFHGALDQDSNAPSANRLWFNLLIAILIGIITTSPQTSFSIISQPMRHQLGFSTLDTQYYLDFSIIGDALGRLAAGCLYRYKGWRACMRSAFVLVAIGQGILFLGVSQYIALSAHLAWCCTFLAGFAVAEMVSTLALITLNNFPASYSGTVIGTLWGCIYVSNGLIYTNIWPYFVKDPADYTASSQAIGIWFGFILIIFLCAPLIALAFMNDWGRGRGITSPIKDVEMDEMTSEKEENTETDPNLKDMVLSRYYLTLFFVYIMWVGPASQLTKDWGKLCESMRLDGLAVNLLRAAAWVSFCSNIFFGFILDKYKRTVPSWVFLSMPSGVLLINSLLSAFFMKFMLQSYIATLSNGPGTVATMFMMAIISDKYGAANMGVLYGIMRLSGAGVNFIVGWFNSAIYDSVAAGQPETNSEGFCYGNECYTIMAGMLIIGMTVLAIFGRERKKSFKSDYLIKN